MAVWGPIPYDAIIYKKKAHPRKGSSPYPFMPFCHRILYYERSMSELSRQRAINWLIYLVHLPKVRSIETT